MKPGSTRYDVKTEVTSKWFKPDETVYTIGWTSWWDTHYDTFDDAIKSMREKVDTLDVRRYSCMLDSVGGSLLVTDQPLPTPTIASYRIGTCVASSDGETRLHYTVELYNNDTNMWEGLYVSRSLNDMEDEMFATARLHLYEDDGHGIPIAGHEDYEIIPIYSDGTAESDGGIAMGAHVVNYYV